MSVAPSICPHCGYNLAQDRPIEDGRFRYDPNEGLFVDGRLVAVSRSRVELVGALMRSNGRILSREVLADRLGESECQANLIAVHLCRLRDLFASLGVPCPIEVVWGRGIRWNTGVHLRDHTRRTRTVAKAAA